MTSTLSNLHNVLYPKQPETCLTPQTTCPSPQITWNIPSIPSNLHVEHYLIPKQPGTFPTPQATWNMPSIPSNLEHSLKPMQQGTCPPPHTTLNMLSIPSNLEHALHKIQPEMALHACVTQQNPVTSDLAGVLHLIIHVVTINIRLFAFTNYFTDL